MGWTEFIILLLFCWVQISFTLLFYPLCKTCIPPVLGLEPTCGALIASKVLYCFCRDTTCPPHVYMCSVKCVFLICCTFYSQNSNQTGFLSVFTVWSTFTLLVNIRAAQHGQKTISHNKCHIIYFQFTDSFFLLSEGCGFKLYGQRIDSLFSFTPEPKYVA